MGGELFKVRDPRALGSLIAIAQSEVPIWHVGALLGIRNLHSAASVPALIKALDDPDPATQYEAVITLAEITNRGGEFGPGRGPFDHDPAKYIQLWKTWWQAEGAAQYGQAPSTPSTH